MSLSQQRPTRRRAGFYRVYDSQTRWPLASVRPDESTEASTHHPRIESLPNEILLEILAYAATHALETAGANHYQVFSYGSLLNPRSSTEVASPRSQLLPVVALAIILRKFGLVNRRFYTLSAAHFFTSRECRVALYCRNEVDPGQVTHAAQMAGEWLRFGAARCFVTNLNIRLELGRNAPDSPNRLSQDDGHFMALEGIFRTCSFLVRTEVIPCILQTDDRDDARVDDLTREVLDVAEDACLGSQRPIDDKITAEIRHYSLQGIDGPRTLKEAVCTVWHAPAYSHEDREAILAAPLPCQCCDCGPAEEPQEVA